MGRRTKPALAAGKKAVTTVKVDCIPESVFLLMSHASKTTRSIMAFFTPKALK